MSASTGRKPKELYEFGPFRIDPEKEILLRGGEPVALTPKTFQILLVLIRHNNELVTKDELIKEVWPDTFVEEANLSRTIFMLRKALGENPPAQRYILTVPGRGYRLAENVRLLPEQDLSIVAAEHSKVEVLVSETRSWHWYVLFLVVSLAVGVGAARLWINRSSRSPANRALVVANFTNSTGDPVFDGTLRQGLILQLEQSPFLSLVSDQRIHHTLQLMGRPADGPLTPEVARQVCARTGSGAVIEASIAQLGKQYIVGLRATSCGNGDVLDVEQQEASRKEDVLKALTTIATNFRRHIGESAATLNQHDKTLADVTTPSLEALEAYTAGWQVHSTNGAIASLPLFKRAVEIDPEFAMAYATLGRVYADLDESDAAAENMTRAWQLRNRASDPEKFFIDANYQMLVTGNLEQARQICETWVETYPRDARPHTLLAGYINKVPGRFDKAVAEARKSIDIDPDFAITYYSLAVAEAYLGRISEAENLLERAAARNLEIDEFIMLDYDIAFLKGDQAAMERVSNQARQRSMADNWISSREANVMAYSGHLQKARSLTARAAAQAFQAGQRERGGLWEAGAAVREALFDNRSESIGRAVAALKLSNDREVEYGAALAFALSGESNRAEQFANDLAKRFPEDTAVQFSYLPVIRAELALNRKDPAKAFEILEAAVPNELGVPRSSIHALFGALYPLYVRGQAYLMAGQGTRASAEFQKILDHSGIVGNDPIGAVARLQLARAYALSGDRDKSSSAYLDFLSLWKNADPEIPILKQAKAEFADLQLATSW
jgi:DNA-binding winged helix-turn-helix (wHTH) protein/tetratricopeptide (TPR) repeat protein